MLQRSESGTKENIDMIHKMEGKLGHVEWKDKADSSWRAKEE